MQFTKQIALDRDNQARLFYIKLIKKSELQDYKDDGNAVSTIIDKWIYLAPQSPYIVRTFDVFEDYKDTCYLMAEYWPNSPNLLQKLKHMELNLGFSAIPSELSGLLLLYIV